MKLFELINKTILICSDGVYFLDYLFNGRLHTNLIVYKDLDIDPAFSLETDIIIHELKRTLRKGRKKELCGVQYVCKRIRFFFVVL